MENILKTAELYKVQLSYTKSGERYSITIGNYKWSGCFIEDIEQEVIEHIKIVA